MKTMRRWATPVTIGSFLLMMVTGVLMFFHADSGLNKLAHEWVGWIMVAGVTLHLFVNFNAFRTYFNKPLANAVMAGFALVLGLSFLSPGGAGGGSPVAGVMRAVSAAPIEQVIALNGEDPVIAMQRLNEQGIPAKPGQSLGTIAGGDREREGEILKVIFNR